MTDIQKILKGLLVAINEDGPAALTIEIETALSATNATGSEYTQQAIAMAVFGSRCPENHEEADPDA